MKKTAQLKIEQNNALRSTLTLENKTYYEDLLVYIRTAGLFYDDDEIEDLLLQILQDILLAQQDGQSAEAFYGKDPKDTADELIQTLNKMSMREGLKLAAMIFGISSFFSILTVLTNPENPINLLVLVMNGLLSLGFVALVFWFIHRGVYKKVRRNKVLSFLSTWLFGIFIIGFFILIQVFAPPVWLVYLKGISGIVILIVLMIIGNYYIFSKPKEERKIELPFLSFIWINGLLGIATRLPWSAEWIGETAAIVLTLSAAGIFMLWTYASMKNE